MPTLILLPVLFSKKPFPCVSFTSRLNLELILFSLFATVFYIETYQEYCHILFISFPQDYTLSKIVQMNVLLDSELKKRAFDVLGA